MGMGMRAAVVFAALVLRPAPAAGVDTSVLGCNERNAGEVGIRELLGDVGDTVSVAVTVHTTAPLDAFALDVAFPETLLSFVRVDPGNLTGAWTLSGAYVSTLHAVRIGGFSAAAIPSGTTGRLAVIQFRVAAAGADSFATGNYLDDLAGYAPCEAANGSTAVSATAWGRVKTLYR